ncbi:hypothetical protein DFJ73DRAFT_626080 [Zopfochytrium polystomum]|nr:hypothetical protein DFJ73DRAFT_626080 [Zopfochytrium polystomum]
MALFIGRLPVEVKVGDLEDIYKKFGPISRLDIKRGTSFNFAFIEFEDKRDAEDALKDTDGKDLPEFNTKLVVEWSRGGRRSGDANECFKCGKEGHWARDCPGNDRGGGRSRSRSRSPPRRRSPPRDRERDRDRDYTRDDRRDDRRERPRSRSPRR